MRPWVREGGGPTHPRTHACPTGPPPPTAPAYWCNKRLRRGTDTARGSTLDDVVCGVAGLLRAVGDVGDVTQQRRDEQVQHDGGEAARGALMPPQRGELCNDCAPGGVPHQIHYDDGVHDEQLRMTADVLRLDLFGQRRLWGVLLGVCRGAGGVVCSV